MKRKRVFAFDLVRAFCPLLIILFHFSELAKYMELPYVLPCQNAGDYATTLFFMVSGGALYQTYQDKLDVIPYLKKRWLGIFPMFYAIWLLSYCVFSILNHRLYFIKPLYTFPLTLIGFDGYLNSYFDTWYLVGEWFLGALLICYLLFPVFRYLSKCKIGSLLLCLAMAVEIILAKNKLIGTSNVLTVTVSFCMGMCLTATRDLLKKKWFLGVPLAVAAVVCSILFPKSLIPYLVKVQIQAAATFVILFPVQDILEGCKPLTHITKMLAHISYPVFLLQHVCIQIVIYSLPSRTGNGVDLLLILLAGTYFVAFTVTFVQDYILKHVHLSSPETHWNHGT